MQGRKQGETVLNCEKFGVILKFYYRMQQTNLVLLFIEKYPMCTVGLCKQMRQCLLQAETQTV